MVRHTDELKDARQNKLTLARFAATLDLHVRVSILGRIVVGIAGTIIVEIRVLKKSVTYEKEKKANTYISRVRDIDNLC